FTGNADQGMPIGQYKRLNVQFEQFEKVAVRGITDSHERIQLRQGIHADKIKCRKLYHEMQEISTESKTLNRRIKAVDQELDMKRERAFLETSGRYADT